MMARGLDAAKLLVTSRALRLRRDHPGWFAGDYQPLHASGVAAAHVAAFCRSDRAITVATRLPADLRQAGGWRDTALRLAPGRWHDVLTGAHHKAVPARRSRSGGWIRPTGEHNQPEPPGWLRLDDLLVHLPVALLVRAEDDTAHDDTGRTATG
jgi:hypothetical protein